MEWRLPDLAESAELLVSELITNSLHASWRLSDRISLVIHVWDGKDEMPVRRNAAPDEEGGRGLMLVENLGQDWGAYRKAAGKVVWARIGARSTQGLADH
jgi:hypothetical protein